MSGYVNNKTKKRINVIDVVIIILVLVLVASVVYRVYGAISNGGASSGQSDYIVKFECDSEYNSLIKYLGEGQEVYFESNGVLLGYIYDDPSDERKAVYEIPKETVTETEDETTAPKGAYSKVRLGGHIKLSDEAVKAKSGNYYTIQDRNISVGSTLKVYTRDAVFTITVKSITKAEK